MLVHRKLSGAGLLIVALACIGPPFVFARPGPPEPGTPVVHPPWEVWHDLSTLAIVDPQQKTLLRSSYCLSGCRYDRHSEGDSRFLRHDGADGEEGEEGDEGVLFEAFGPGAITRIWMTSGEGVSKPLDPGTTLRIYIDGATEPVFQGPLPSLFDGSRKPFVQPLAGDRDVSSGGNFSYVPIPYGEGCRITLSGGDDTNLWFQFSHYKLASADGIVSFRGDEDLTAWETLHRRAGKNPWPEPNRGERHRAKLMVKPGANVLAALQGPAEITGFMLDLPRTAWTDSKLAVTFDGKTTIAIPVSDFFGQGRLGVVGTRSLMVGVDRRGRLYCYFPMPFWKRAEFVLDYSGGDPVRARVEFTVRNVHPHPDSGYLGVQLQTTDGSTKGQAHPLLELDGAGKWVGLIAELSAKGTRQYLEGDERINIDGELESSDSGGGSPRGLRIWERDFEDGSVDGSVLRHCDPGGTSGLRPTLHGTGVEDFFNGGFYFDGGPLQLPLHGAPRDIAKGKHPYTAMYRFMLTDAITFGSSICAEVEAGPTGNVAMRARSVAFYYSKSESPD